VNAQVLARGRSVVVDINRDAAARLGVTALTIDNALYDAFGQRIISTIYTQSSQNRVILQGTPQMISDPRAWSSSTFRSAAERRCRWAPWPACMRARPRWCWRAKASSRRPPSASIWHRASRWAMPWRRSSGWRRDRPARFGHHRFLGLGLGLPAGAVE
jgi:hypothetical protein